MSKPPSASASTAAASPSSTTPWLLGLGCACLLVGSALWAWHRPVLCPVTGSPLTPEQLKDPSLLVTRPDGSRARVCCQSCVAAVQAGRA